MAILFAVVARGSTVLAKYASCAGNFLEVAEQILSKLSGEDSKMTYSHGNYLFHYISDDRIVYMAITEDDFERSRAFKFLADIRKRFMTTYGKYARTALPYSMDTEFSSVLMLQMRHYNKPVEETGRLEEIQDQVDELKDIMVKNIDSVVARGENLDLLVDKTENLSDSSVTFLKRSASLERSLRYKNYKIMAVIVVGVLILVYIIVSIACKGPGWPQCVNHNSNNNSGQH